MHSCFVQSVEEILKIALQIALVVGVRQPFFLDTYPSKEERSIPFTGSIEWEDLYESIIKRGYYPHSLFATMPEDDFNKLLHEMVEDATKPGIGVNWKGLNCITSPLQPQASQCNSQFSQTQDMNDDAKYYMDCLKESVMQTLLHWGVSVTYTQDAEHMRPPQQDVNMSDTSPAQHTPYPADRQAVAKTLAADMQEAYHELTRLVDKNKTRLSKKLRVDGCYDPDIHPAITNPIVSDADLLHCMHAWRAMAGALHGNNTGTPWKMGDINVTALGKGDAFGNLMWLLNNDMQDKRVVMGDDVGTSSSAHWKYSIKFAGGDKTVVIPKEKVEKLPFVHLVPDSAIQTMYGHMCRLKFSIPGCPAKEGKTTFLLSDAAYSFLHEHIE